MRLSAESAVGLWREGRSCGCGGRTPEASGPWVGPVLVTTSPRHLAVPGAALQPRGAALRDSAVPGGHSESSRPRPSPVSLWGPAFVGPAHSPTPVLHLSAPILPGPTHPPVWLRPLRTRPQVWPPGPSHTLDLNPPYHRTPPASGSPICPDTTTTLSPPNTPHRLTCLALCLQMLYTGIVIYAPALILNQGLTLGGGGAYGQEGAQARDWTGGGEGAAPRETREGRILQTPEAKPALCLAA